MAAPTLTILSFLVCGGFQHAASGARISSQKTAAAALAESGGAPSKYIAGVPIYGYEHFEASALLQGGKLHEAKGSWIVELNDHVATEEVHQFCEAEPGCDCLMEGHPSEGGLPICEVRCTESAFERLLAAFRPLVEFAEHEQPIRAFGGGQGVLEGEAEAEAASELAEDEGAQTPRFGVETWSLKLKDGANAEALCAGRRDCVPAAQSSFVDLRATPRELEELVAANPGAVEFHGPRNSSLAEVQWGWGRSSAPWGVRRVQARSGVPSSDSLPANGGTGVHVYVLDTGIRTSHGDFGGRAYAAYEVSTDRWGRAQGRQCSPTSRTCAADGQGHGTHCAGTVAGKVYGVAKGAKVHAVKVMGDDGTGSSAGLLAGMDWVATNALRPAVASMSLGGPRSNAENRAVQTMNQAGVTVVVAAGNENSDACQVSPASATAAITVGSTEQRGDRRSSFSNYGRCLNIFGPGSDILSASHRSDSGGVSQSGTSMACPHVAGAAALILGGGSTLSPDEVKAKLLSGATPNAVADPQRSSPNLLLYTGTGGGSSPAPQTPTPAPTPPVSGGCPSFAKSGKPDSDGDCHCKAGYRCYRQGSLGYSSGCPYSRTGYASTTYFSPTCSACKCLNSFR